MHSIFRAPTQTQNPKLLTMAATSSSPTTPVHPRTFEDPYLGDQPSVARKVKFLCSFGGRILPRPSDGALRYVGGDTRIIALRKDISFPDLMQKMIETNGGPAVVKYQLPDEDLDSLVTLSCAEDLDNMMEEYEKFAGASQDGSAKLWVFLFSPSELETPTLGPLGDTGKQRYADALNGFGDSGLGVPGRKETLSEESSSAAALDSDAAVDSATASAEGTSSPALQSPTVAHASGLVAPLGAQGAGPFAVRATVGGTPLQTTGPIRTNLLRPPPVAGVVGVPQTYGHSPVDNFSYANYNTTDSGRVQNVNPQQLGIGGAPAGYAAVAPQAYELGLPSSTLLSPSAKQVGEGLEPDAAMLGIYAEGSAYGGKAFQVSGDPNCTRYQTLSQSRPFPTTSSQASDVNRFGGFRARHASTMGLEDCMMCHKAVPHSHSDTLLQEHGTGSKASAFKAYPVFHSLPLEDIPGSQALPKIPTYTLPYGTPMEQNVHGEVPMPRSDSYGYSCSTSAHSAPQSDSYGYSYGTSAQGDNMTYPTDFQFCHTPHIPYENAVQQQQVPQLAPGQHMVRHDPLINNSAGVSGNLTIDGMVQNSELPFNGAGTEKSYEYKLPVAGLEALHLSPETSGISDHWKIDIKPESESPKDINCSKSLINIDSGDSDTLQTGGNDIFMATGYHEISSDGNSVRPMEQLPSSTLDVNPSNIQHEVSSQLPAPLDYFDLYSHGINTGAEPPHPNERLLGLANSSKILVKDMKGHESQLHSGNPLPSPNMNKPDLNYPDARDSYPSDSLFSESDPWKIMQNVEMMPPSKHAKVAAGELPIPNDSIFEDDLKTSGILPKSVLVEEEKYLQLPDSLHKDPCFDYIEPVKGLSEKQAKQELKDVAEDEAASVIQTSSPLTPVFPATERNMCSPDTDSAQGINDNVTSQHAMFSDRNKNEDIETKQPDKLGLGTPITEDIERLQIIRNSDLEELRELGAGTFGTVYHGKWRGSDVAIKRINDRCFFGKPSEQERLRADFRNEAIKLASLHHPNVVTFYGVVLDGTRGSVATVTEYMANGSLRSALQSSDRPLDRRKRLLIAMDVAFGMEYLHGKNIVHFDLKSDNLLVNLRDPQRPICKVGDLGLSKVKCQTLISGGVRGTLPWMAPELLNGNSILVTEKVDVFSFGIVMWELLTGEEPYADLHYGAIIGGIVSNTLRPLVPESCDLQWRALMEQCWSSEHSDRPSFMEIAAKLRSMAVSHSRKGQPQVDSTASRIKR